jgi:hypothetical protein
MYLSQTFIQFFVMVIAVKFNVFIIYDRRLGASEVGYQL